MRQSWSSKEMQYAESNFGMAYCISANQACMGENKQKAWFYAQTFLQSAFVYFFSLHSLFLHYENDTTAYGIKYEYLFGQDILVAPVYQEKIEVWQVYLPEDEWIHFWTGKTYLGGNHTISAPIGYPPVFFRKKSTYRELFESIGEMNVL